MENKNLFWMRLFKSKFQVCYLSDLVNKLYLEYLLIISCISLYNVGENIPFRSHLVYLHNNGLALISVIACAQFASRFPTVEVEFRDEI